jgi:hypothetical protein
VRAPISFLFEIVLAIWVSLIVDMNSRNFFLLFPQKMLFQFLISIVLSPWIVLSSMGILTILNLPIYVHEIFLFMFLISFSNVL